MSFQQVTALGNLGRDVETRYTPDGKAIASFSLAVSEKYKDKEHTEWINCTAFGKTAEIASQYLAKGSKCLVVGRLKTEKYTDKAGVEKYSVKVIVDKLSLESPRNENSARGPKERGSNEKSVASLPDDLDDLPF